MGNGWSSTQVKDDVEPVIYIMVSEKRPRTSYSFKQMMLYLKQDHR